MRAPLPGGQQRPFTNALLNEGLVVVVEGLLVLSGVVGDEPRSGQWICLACGAVVVSVQGEGSVTVVSGGVEAARPAALSASTSHCGWSMVR